MDSGDQIALRSMTVLGEQLQSQDDSAEHISQYTREAHVHVVCKVSWIAACRGLQRFPTVQRG